MYGYVEILEYTWAYTEDKMHCTRKVTDDVIWVGADNRRLLMFEGVYSAPTGISYNSYLIKDERTALLDTVDRAVSDRFFDNISYALGGRALDYLVVHHMEPDHSAGIMDVLLRYPDVTLVLNKKTYDMLSAFTGIEPRAKIVSDGETLELGRHTLTFTFAPMVHWPEVMVSFDAYDGTLYSADAFGTFGALNGALFADEVDFDRDYLDEARRYYGNIVGKYGVQVMSLLNKTKAFDIKRVCPLHGFVWRENIDYFVNKYIHWASYKPEKQGVVIAYASVYGNTECAANLLACRLRELGIECVMHDTSVSEESWIIADAFKYSHLVFASPAYNGGIFVTMENLLHDIAAHGIKGRHISLIESGSWALSAGKKMKEIIESLKDTVFVGDIVSFKSSLNSDESINSLADEIERSIAACDSNI